MTVLVINGVTETVIRHDALSEALGDIFLIIIVISSFVAAHYSLTKSNSNNNINNVVEWSSYILENSPCHQITSHISGKIGDITANVWLVVYILIFSLFVLLLEFAIFGIPEYDTSVNLAVYIILGASLIPIAYATGSIIGQLQNVGERINQNFAKSPNYNHEKTFFWFIGVVSLTIATHYAFENIISVGIIFFISILLPTAELVLISQNKLKVTRIGLVSSIKTKGDNLVAPENLYTHDYTEKMCSHAQQHLDDWYILSTEDGLIDPDEESFEPFSHTHIKARKDKKMKWAKQVVEQLEKKELLSEDVTLVLHAGQDYYEELLPLIDDTGVTVEIPTKEVYVGEINNSI